MRGDRYVASLFSLPLVLFLSSAFFASPSIAPPPREIIRRRSGLISWRQQGFLRRKEDRGRALSDFFFLGSGAPVERSGCTGHVWITRNRPVAYRVGDGGRREGPG
ncbi:hypothetical protein Zmor_012651 [Zophobas morio]|uniref:Secreted protein n=1 Tax=Zophobas morio TaxID=2755281 RepID=A0AA38IGC6_9CUCU|nr:hypothetical protein Zmor_012651 [Zophobas morio]